MRYVLIPVMLLALGFSTQVQARGDGFHQQPQQQPQQQPAQTQPTQTPAQQRPTARPLSEGEMLQLAEEAVAYNARKERARGEGLSVNLEMGKVSYESGDRARIKGNGYIRTPHVNERIFYNVSIDLRTGRAIDAHYRNDDSPN